MATCVTCLGGGWRRCVLKGKGEAELAKLGAPRHALLMWCTHEVRTRYCLSTILLRYYVFVHDE